jgi:hypothetical protein
MRPVPELVVSVLDPGRLPGMLRVKCLQADEPGCTSKVIECLKDCKLELLEHVTSAAGEMHELSLVCFAQNGDNGKETCDALETRLSQGGFVGIRVTPYVVPEILWMSEGEVQAGWIRTVDWRRELQVQCGAEIEARGIDISRAVLSADTTHRFLRYVFPYKEARTISVEHRNEPQVLKRIADTFRDHDINILSGVLRRGGAKPESALWVVTCEPGKRRHATGLYDQLFTRLKALPPADRVHPKFRDAMDPSIAVTPRERYTVSARVPPNLRETYNSTKHAIPEGVRSVFFSHRYRTDARSMAIYATVREAVRDCGWHLLEPRFNDKYGEALIPHQVAAEMWVADAALVVIVGERREDSIGFNIPHEWGFFSGSGKPIIAFLDDEFRDPHQLWTNVDGTYIPRFPSKEVLLVKEDPRSLYRQVIDRLKGLVRAS